MPGKGNGIFHRLMLRAYRAVFAKGWKSSPRKARRLTPPIYTVDWLEPRLVLSPVLPAYLDSNGAGITFTQTSSGYNLTVSTGGIATLKADPGTAVPLTVNVEGGSFFVAPGGPDIIHLGGLSLSDGATMDIANVGSSWGFNSCVVLVVGNYSGSYVTGPSDTPFAISSSSKIDMENNVMIVHDSGADPNDPDFLYGDDDPTILDGDPITDPTEYTNVFGAVKSAYDDGAWDGATGITSTAVQEINTEAGLGVYGLATIRDGDLQSPFGDGTSGPLWMNGASGEPVGLNDVMLLPTYVGDLDLNNKVDTSDTAIDGLFYDGGATTSNPWPLGDLDYNGKLDTSDSALFGQLYGDGVVGDGAAYNPTTAPTFLNATYDVVGASPAIDLTWGSSYGTVADYLVVRTDNTNSANDHTYTITDPSTHEFVDTPPDPTTDNYTYQVFAEYSSNPDDSSTGQAGGDAAPASLVGIANALRFGAGTSLTVTSATSTSVTLNIGGDPLAGSASGDDDTLQLFESADGNTFTAVSSSDLSPSTLTPSTSDQTCTVSGLSPGTPYYFAAETDNGGGLYSVPVETSATTLPAAPATPTATPGDGVAYLNWTPVSGATSYNVYAHTGSSYTLLGTTSSAGFVVSTGADGSALADGTAYSLDVSANTDGGEGEKSADVTCTPVASELTASFQADNVSTSETDLSWDPTYAADLYVSTDGVTFSLLAAGVCGGSYHATDLQDGQTYYFRAGAIIAPLSAAESFTAPVTASTDYTITSLTATPTSTASIALNWATLANVTRIDIYRSVDDGPYDFLTDSTVSSSLTPTSTSYADNTVQEGHDYSYQLQAVVAQVAGGEALTQVSQPADAQTMLVATSAYGPASTGYALQWTQLPLVGDTISGAAIYRASSEDGTFGFLAGVDPAATSFTDTSASAGSAYWYEVVYTGAHGNYTSAPIGPGTSDGSLATLMATSDQSMSGVLADFVGPFADTSAGDYAATITTGDGTTVAGTVASDGNGGFLVSGAYNYTTPALDSLAISLYTGGADVGDIVEMVNVKDGGPAVTTAASATLSDDGTTATLDVTADDPAGEDDLSYTWATTGTPPAAVTFDDNSDNDASEVEATFTATGTYEFQVTITDSAGLSTTSSVSLDVTQVGSDLEVTPDTPTITAGQSEQLTATEYDQFDLPMATQPSYTWGIISSDADQHDEYDTITSGGLYTSDIHDDGTTQITVSANDGQYSTGSVNITPVLSISSITLTGITGSPAEYQAGITESAPADMTCHIEVAPANGNFATDDALLFPQAGDYTVRLAGFLNGQVTYSDPVDFEINMPTAQTRAWDTSAGGWVWDAARDGAFIQYEDPAQSGTWYTLSDGLAVFPPYFLAGQFDTTSIPWSGLTVRVLQTSTDPTTGAFTITSDTIGTPPDYNPSLYDPVMTGSSLQSDGSTVFTWEDPGSDEEAWISLGANPTSMSYGSPVPDVTSYDVPAGDMAALWFENVDATQFSAAFALKAPPAAPTLAAPTNVNAAPFDDSQNSSDTTGLGVDISWQDNSTTETGFNILRSDTTIDGTYTQVGTVGPDVQSYVDTSVPQQSAHYYKIEAVSASGNADSTPYTIPIPAAPSSLTATTDDDGGVELSWQGVSGATGYDIQWSTTDGSFVTIDTSTTTSYDDTDPNVGAANYYRVDAFNNSNPDQLALEGPPSSVASDAPIEDPTAVDYIDNGLNAAGGFAPYVSKNGQAVTVPASQGVLSECSDPQALALTASLEDAPDHGSVTVNSDGSFTYTPNNGFVGTDTFDYCVTNSANLYSVGTVAIDCYDPAPTATNAVAVRPDSGALNSPAHGLDKYVTNPSSTPLTYSLAPGGGPKNGTLTLNSDGSFTYTARSGFHGWDHFSYIANDGYANSNVAQVNIAPSQTAATTAGRNATHNDATWQGLHASYVEAVQRLDQLGGYAQAYKALVTQFADSQDPDDESAMNAMIAAGDQMQTSFNSYMNQLTATQRLVGQYTRTEGFLEVDNNLLSQIDLLPTDPFQIKLSQEQAAAVTAAAQAEGDGVGYWLDTTTRQIKVMKIAHAATTVASLAVVGVGLLEVTSSGLITMGQIAAGEGGWQAASWYCAKKFVIAGFGVGVNYALQSATQKLADMLGWSEDQVQIVGDCFQLLCFMTAWRAEALAADAAAGSNCFVGSTVVKVETASGEVDEPIDEIHLGDRVDASVDDSGSTGAPPPTLGSATEVDPSTYREVDLTMPDPQSPGDSYAMQLLEPLSWISANGAAVGSWIHLSLPEMQVSGDAEVLAIKACPAISAGAGDVVLGTFQHVSNNIVDVALQGESQPLEVTSGHPIWSLDRGAWVAAGDLLPGERVAGENGPVVVESVTDDSAAQTVYNLDVENDHRYLVTDLGILVHNISPLQQAIEDARGTLRAAMKAAYGAAMEGKEAHHGIPIELLKDPTVWPLIKKAIAAGFEFNGAENGVIVPKIHFEEDHPKYTQYVKQFLLKHAPTVRTNAEARALLDDIVEACRENVDYWFPE